MSRRLIVALVVATTLVVLMAGAVAAQGTPTKQVGLVVGLPNGQEHLEIVTVPMTATTFDVLQAAKIVLISQNTTFGPAVCSINGAGCPATNCFCDPAHFWAYYHLNPAHRTWTTAMESVGAYVPPGARWKASHGAGLTPTSIRPSNRPSTPSARSQPRRQVHRTAFLSRRRCCCSARDWPGWPAIRAMLVHGVRPADERAVEDWLPICFVG